MSISGSSPQSAAPTPSEQGCGRCLLTGFCCWPASACCAPDRTPADVPALACGPRSAWESRWPLPRLILRLGVGAHHASGQLEQLVEEARVQHQDALTNHRNRAAEQKVSNRTEWMLPSLSLAGGGASCSDMGLLLELGRVVGQGPVRCSHAPGGSACPCRLLDPRARPPGKARRALQSRVDGMSSGQRGLQRHHRATPPLTAIPPISKPAHRIGPRHTRNTVHATAGRSGQAAAQHCRRASVTAWSRMRAGVRRGVDGSAST
jgi:hypothetical protein